MEAATSSRPGAIRPMSGWLMAALAVGPLSVALFWLASLNPALVEAWYSRGLFAVINPFLVSVTRLVPFALAEFALPLLILALLGVWFLTPRAWLYDLVILSVVLAWFVLAWGLNYQRQPWAVTVGLTVTGGTAAELEALARKLVAQANSSYEAKPVDWRALVPATKPAMFSEGMSWLGIAGIYLPWTAEPLVNTGPPAWSVAFSAAHEASHQLGWAREDEANFLAWKGLSEGPERSAKYAAALGALPYVAQALLSASGGPEAWQTVAGGLSDPVRADWKANQAYWERFAGPAQKLSQAVNDTYLKTQGQSDGVRSYGRMVDLLLAWNRYSSKPEIHPPPPAPAP